MKKFLALLVATLLSLTGSAPALPVRADTVGSGLGSGTDIGSNVKPYRRDENYVDVQPGDIDIWDNGKGISISGGGQVCTVDYSYSQYAVLVSKYLDADGQYTVEVNIFMYGSYAYLNPQKTYTSDDGSVYSKVYFATYPNAMFSETQGKELTIKMRGGKFMSSSGNWQEEPIYFMEDEPYKTGMASSSAGLYISPYYSRKYIIYSSSEYVGSGYEGFPVNLLPNAPMGAGATNIPYKTTFRMLSGDATVYNTFYYTSSYMSGADEISASGTIRLDATKLADGTVTRTRPSAPQLLCQKSTYGTAYDIVSTNDENLLSLLGISKPPEKYWDVAAQEWKNVSSGGGSGTGGGTGGGNTGGSDVDSSLLVEDKTNLSTINGLTVKLVGDDALIDATRFNDYYANHTFLSHDNILADINTPVWGLGNYITWEYDGTKYDQADGDKLINSTKNHRRIKLVIKAKFRLDASTTKTLAYTVYDYGSKSSLMVSSGSYKVSFYDLCRCFQSAYPEYITDFPSQLQQVTYYLTPFYYDNDDGKYHYGSTSRITQNVKSALADYAGGEWDGDNGGWTVEKPSFSWDSALGFFDNIANFVSDLFSPIRNFAEQLGQVGGLFGKLFSFLPNEISGYLQMAFMGCLVIGIVRWLRG